MGRLDSRRAVGETKQTRRKGEACVSSGSSTKLVQGWKTALPARRTRRASGIPKSRGPKHAGRVHPSLRASAGQGPKISFAPPPGSRISAPKSLRWLPESRTSVQTLAHPKRTLQNRLASGSLVRSAWASLPVRLPRRFTLGPAGGIF